MLATEYREVCCNWPGSVLSLSSIHNANSCYAAAGGAVSIVFLSVRLPGQGGASLCNTGTTVGYNQLISE